MNKWFSKIILTKLISFRLWKTVGRREPAGRQDEMLAGIVVQNSKLAVLQVCWVQTAYWQWGDRKQGWQASDHSSRLSFSILKGWERDGWSFSLMVEYWPKISEYDDLRLQNLRPFKDSNQQPAVFIRPLRYLSSDPFGRKVALKHEAHTVLAQYLFDQRRRLWNTILGITWKIIMAELTVAFSALRLVIIRRRRRRKKVVCSSSSLPPLSHTALIR